MTRFGWPPDVIAKHLKRKPQAVRDKICAEGIAQREHRPCKVTIALSDDATLALLNEAAKYGLALPVMLRIIIETVVLDDLIAATLCVDPVLDAVEFAHARDAAAPRS